MKEEVRSFWIRFTILASIGVLSFIGFVLMVYEFVRVIGGE